MPPVDTRQRHGPHTDSAVCPFCALLCDDLILRSNDDSSFTIRRNGCSRAALDFSRPATDEPPRVQGQATSHDDAIRVATRILKKSRRPLFGGLATDVDGMRAIINLAERSHGIVDHLHGDALTSMTRLMQTRGWYATTLSEVRNRADLVIVADVDFNDRYENFERHCLKPQTRLQGGRAPARKVVFVGTGANSPGVEVDMRLGCSRDGLGEVFSALLAGLRGHRMDARRPGGVKPAAIAELVEAIQAANYCTIVFAPGQLGSHRESIIATFCDLVDAINQQQRAALLALGGDDGGQSALSTTSWLTGYPLRTEFGKTLAFEPQINRTADLLATRTVDCLLWTDAYGRNPTPPSTGVETIVIGARPSASRRPPAVFIPVGTPGLDHGGRLVRTDSVVTLQLVAQRESRLASVAQIATQILDSW